MGRRKPLSPDQIMTLLRAKNTGQFDIEKTIIPIHRTTGFTITLYCNVHGEYPRLLSNVMRSEKIHCAMCPGICGYLKDKYPELYAQINMTTFKEEFNMDPEMLTCGSNKKIQWKCPNGHEFYRPINERTRWADTENSIYDTDCSQCNTLGYIHPDIAAEWHPTKNGDLTPFDVGASVVRVVWWQCPEYPEHVYDMSINSRSKSGCPYCVGKRVCDTNRLSILSPLLASQWDYTKNEFGPEDYTVGSGEKVWWLCPMGHSWCAVIASRYSGGHGCKQCNQGKYSKKAIEWLEAIMFDEGIHIQHATNGGEKAVGDRLVHVDGYCAETDTAYEFHGKYWHGDPRVHSHDGKNAHNGISFKDLYDRTIKKEEYIRTVCKKLVVMWEYDYPAWKTERDARLDKK